MFSNCIAEVLVDPGYGSRQSGAQAPCSLQPDHKPHWSLSKPEEKKTQALKDFTIRGHQGFKVAIKSIVRAELYEVENWFSSETCQPQILLLDIVQTCIA